MRTLIFATAFAIAGLSASARAGTLLDVAVIDRDTGRSLPTYTDHGKMYVAGTPGHRYSVHLSNRSGGRVLAVLSVDGVNAVSGETASPEQTGYVLGAYESAEISGWRKSLDEVAQFNFTSLASSYAARTGRPANVGVIGVAVFTERVPLWRERELDARPSTSPSAPGASDAAAPHAESRAAAGAEPMPAQAAKSTANNDAIARRDERLGTGHGAREFARVDTTTFERASRHPAETVAIWYDSYANLVAQGIIERPLARTNPRPFPGAFVADPPPR